MSTVEIVTYITAKPGKSGRILELLGELAQFAEKNEPGTLGYSVNQEVDKESPNIVVKESFKDEAAYKAHQSSEPHGRLFQTAEAEDLIAAPPQVFQGKRIAGFYRTG